jgi:hypothetical protein
VEANGSSSSSSDNISEEACVAEEVVAHHPEAPRSFLNRPVWLRRWWLIILRLQDHF